MNWTGWSSYWTRPVLMVSGVEYRVLLALLITDMSVMPEISMVSRYSRKDSFIGDSREQWNAHDTFKCRLAMR